MGQKHEKLREFCTPFPPRDIRKNPRSMYARVPQVMAQFVLKIELLSHIMGTTPILEMARAYGLRPRLWLLTQHNIFETQVNICETQHKIIETQHKIIERQHKTIETQLSMKN